MHNLDVDALGQLEHGIGDEEIAALGRWCNGSLEFVDAYAALRKYMGDLVHDARVILTGELEPHMGAAVIVGDAPGAFSRDGQQAPGLELVEIVEQRFGPCVADLYEHDARELASKFRQVTSIPVAAVIGNDAGDGIDEACSVVADECDHYGSHRRTVVACVTARSSWPRNTGRVRGVDSLRRHRGARNEEPQMSTTTITANEFEETVLADGIVLVDFWADWCGPCKAFAPVYETVSERYPEITFAKVDTEQEQQLSGQLGIRSIPTIMAFRDGIQLFSQPGAMGEGDLTELVTQIEKLDMDEIRQQIADAADADGEPES